MVQSILQTAADNYERVHQTVEDEIAGSVSSTDDIVLTDYSTDEERVFQFVNVTTGEVGQLPIEFASTTPTTANLTRSRPSAYIIPRAWPGLAARLRATGLEIEDLPSAFCGTVEALNVTSLSFSDSYYEGVVLTTVCCESTEREVVLPPGSFMVSTTQKNATLAFVALEPEKISILYVSFNVIPWLKGIRILFSELCRLALYSLVTERAEKGKG